MKQVELPFGKTIYQSDVGQSITTDTKFVVDTILNETADNPKSVLELGSGNGIISIMLAHYRICWQITGIDIQPHLVDLANKNSLLAEVNAAFLPFDLKTYNSKFDLVIANPPFYEINKGKISPNEERAVSRHEVECTMIDVLKCAKRNMKEKAFIIYPGSRFEELKKNVKKVDLKIAAKFILNAENSKDNGLSMLAGKSKILVELIHV